jgi:hypothetical protein
MRFSGRC